MAGKTFTGIGLDDLLKEKPPLSSEAAADAVPVNPGEGEDLHSANSEPTIVDEDKVAEGLQRLRSLQTIHGMPAAPPAATPRPVLLGGTPRPVPFGAPPRPAAPLTVTPLPDSDAEPELVADMGSSEPTRIGMPAARPTAVGRTSDLEPPGKQLVVQPDNLRGTMFGHTVHLPDLHERLDAEDAPSGPIYTPPPPAPGAPTTQLVPYKEPPRMPSFHGVEPYPRHRRPGYSQGAYPTDEHELRTETIPPLGRRGYARAILVMFGLALAALGTLGYMRFRTGEAEDVRGPAPALASQAPAPPASAPQPNAAGANPGAPSPPATTERVVGAPAPSAAGSSAEPAVAGNPTAKPSGANEGAPSAAGAPAPLPASSGSPAADVHPTKVVAGPPSRPASALEPAKTRRSGDGAGPSTDSPGAESRRRPGRGDRRRAPAAEGPADEAPSAPGKAKPTRKGAAGQEEDPDATLPPSSMD